MNIILYMSITKLPIFYFCSKVTDQCYEHNFQHMEQLMKKQMTHHNRSSFFTKIFQEFDTYKQELEKLGVRQSIKDKDIHNSSSGSAGSSTKQELHQKHANFASKAVKKVFGELIRDFNTIQERYNLRTTSQRAINIQKVIMQSEESKQSSDLLGSVKK